MSIKKISIKVNNSKETIEQYSVTGGENGAGKLKQPLHINAQKNVNYLLIDIFLIDIVIHCLVSDNYLLN